MWYKTIISFTVMIICAPKNVHKVFGIYRNKYNKNSIKEWGIQKLSLKMLTNYSVTHTGTSMLLHP